MNVSKLVVTLMALGALCGQALAQAVQLKSGVVLIGDIKDPSGDGLTLQRFDTGGVLQLKWDDLSPSSTQQLKQLYHLAGEEEVEVMADANAVTFEIPGGRIEEVVGLIVDQDATNIYLRTKSVAKLPIARSAIRTSRTRQVKATELYTRDELYSQKLVEIAPGEDADKHIKLADLLISTRDFEHGRLHLEQAQKLGNSKQPGLLEKKLARLKLYEESAAEKALLDEINVASGRNEYQRALEIIKKYEAAYPQGKLRPEFESAKLSVDKRQKRWVIARVAELWYTSIPHVADHKIADRTVTYAQVKTYAETQMGKEIRATILKALPGLLQTEEDVKKAWDQRLEIKSILKANLYSYGLGTWLLGAAGVLEGTKQGEFEAKDAEKKKPVDEETDRLIRRIKDARDRAKKAGQSEQQQQTEEGWWKEARPETRSLWVQAYYAEKSGDLKLVRAMVEPCINCAGEGTITEIGDTGQPKKSPCFLCHGVRFTRRIRAQ